MKLSRAWGDSFSLLNISLMIQIIQYSMIEVNMRYEEINEGVVYYFISYGLWKYRLYDFHDY